VKRTISFKTKFSDAILFAERASDETDREFWTGLARRWQELLETGRYGGPTPQDIHNLRRKIYTKRIRAA
jgi:hypothetical protein